MVYAIESALNVDTGDVDFSIIFFNPVYKVPFSIKVMSSALTFRKASLFFELGLVNLLSVDYFNNDILKNSYKSGLHGQATVIFRWFGDFWFSFG